MQFDELSLTEKEQQIFNEAVVNIVKPYYDEIEKLKKENEKLKKKLEAYTQTGYEPWEYEKLKFLEEENMRLNEEVQSLIMLFADKL